MQGAHLMGAHLKEATFWKTHLERADLVEAPLQGALLWETLQGRFSIDIRCKGFFGSLAISMVNRLKND